MPRLPGARRHIDCKESNQVNPSKKETLFIIGSPRSGTTWLQLLVAQHPDVATNKETQLFTQYVSRLQERWAEELREAATGTTNGLSRIMSEDEFLHAVKGFCDRVLEKLSADAPEARFVLEKSPEHALHAETILKLYPEAWFLHIIRDPRAVSNSFRHAAGKWWTWAPSGPIETTRRWKRNVVAGRQIAELTPRYREVRYEEISEGGTEVLEGIFAWLGLEANREFSEEALAACDIDRLKVGALANQDQPWAVGREPEGFFRAGKQDGWKSELTARQVRLVEHEAEELMLELGYDPAQPTNRKKGTPHRVRAHRVVDWAQRATRDLWHRVDWRLGRMRRKM